MRDKIVNMEKGAYKTTNRPPVKKKEKTRTRKKNRENRRERERERENCRF